MAIQSTDPRFVAPGKGPWELENTHFPRPTTRFVQEAFPEGFIRGFSEGTARYGVLLSHIKPGFAGDFFYGQPVPFGAPEGAMGPPPKIVLQLLTRLHPGMRKRIAAGVAAVENKVWREDLKRWDEVDKPAAIAQHRAIQAIDTRALTDTELAAHVADCAAHVRESVYLHHKYTIASTFPVGDFLAGAVEWTGLPAGELLGVLRGSSAISKGFAAAELEDAGKAISQSDPARALLASGGSSAETLAALRADAEAGEAVAAYLDTVQWRSVGYDVGDETAGELPDMLLNSLRVAVDGGHGRPEDSSALAVLREQVPAEHREEFDSRLGEVRLIYRLRDERGAYGDGWATGLARRALLEAGRRLVASGQLPDAVLAVDLTVSELQALLTGGAGPSAAEVEERRIWRTTHTTDDAPQFLNAEPSPPPPMEWLPAKAHRTVKAIDTMLFNLNGVCEIPNTDSVLNGLPVNAGVYEGPARLIAGPADFDRIQQGDVLITKMTSPYFNVVLPLLGAIVTDRGGQLSHAAIVAREYGIPGIVGTRDATSKIADGARVRVDGSTGEVHLVG